jgi:hypothetical protein
MAGIFPEKERGSEVSATPTEPEELRQEIAQTRAELGATVEALAHKADVKARAHETAEEVRERVHGAVDSVAYQMGRQRERIARLDPRVRVGLIALAAGLVALFVVRKVRGRSS